MSVPQFDYQLDSHGSHGANMSLARQRALGHTKGKAGGRLSQFDPSLYGFENSATTPGDARPKVTANGNPPVANARKPFAADAAIQSTGPAANTNLGSVKKTPNIAQDHRALRVLATTLEYAPPPKPGSFGDDYKNELKLEKQGHTTNLQKLAETDSRLAQALQENPAITTLGELVSLENKHGGHWRPRHGKHGAEKSATAKPHKDKPDSEPKSTAEAPATGAKPAGVKLAMNAKPTGPTGGMAS